MRRIRIQKKQPDFYTHRMTEMNFGQRTGWQGCGKEKGQRSAGTLLPPANATTYGVAI
jgi:hypothetical protein